jgi:hypothetical protein
MKNFQPPQLLTDLYRDLRDRRLLLPALALVVALIAVPMALSSSASPTGTTPATSPEASEPGAETAAEAAVLTRQLGVTAYKKRLDRFNEKNPFHQQFTLPEVTSKLDQSSVTEPLGNPTGVTTSGSGSSTTSSTTEPATSSASPGGSTDTPTSSEPSGGSGGSTKPTLFVFQADLAIGPPGDLSRRKSVELGKLLPSEAKAMIAFSGATEDMKHALFLITDDVSSVTGDGRCVPGPANCKLLKLKVGDEAKLAYAPESDRIYKLKLFGIGLAPADAKASNKRGKRGSPSAFVAQG